MRIKIESIPHKLQRYETAGDYYTDKEKTLFIKVDEHKNKKYEYILALHEYIEMTLAIFRGISFKSIDDFDKKFKGEGEPGDETNAPYFNEHQFATKLEKMFCQELDISWEQYLEDTDIDSNRTN